MDSVGEILAEKQREAFPWVSGTALAAALHLGILGAFLASSMAHPMRLAPPRVVAVRILSAGSIRGAEAARPAAAPIEQPKPRIEKPPPEEAPPPPSKNAVLLPAREEKKKRPTPAPVPAPARPSSPAAPDVSLPSYAAESQSSGSAATAAGAGGTAGIGRTQFDQADFKYDYYTYAVTLALSTNWFSPIASFPIPPRVHFRISRDGSASDVEIVQSSRIPSVDLAARKAVWNSVFPPLPPDWPGSSVGLTVTFEAAVEAVR
jgi:TonB family protein